MKDNMAYDDWILKNLEKLDFVEWDRFIEFRNQNDDKVTRVYGWIEREDDDYKDFVHLEFWDQDKEVYFLGTSSEEYSLEINKRLKGEEKAKEDHAECRRVEDRFENLENKIELDRQESEG